LTGGSNNDYYNKSMSVATRDRLIDAAVEVFSECGYEGTRVQEIARRAGLTTGAIYGHFRGKADLLHEAIEGSSTSELDALLSSVSEIPADDVLTFLGTHLIDPSPSSNIEALLLEAVVAGRREPGVAEHLRTAFDEQARRLAALFVHGKREGTFDPDVSTSAAVRFSMALALGLLAMRSIGMDAPDQQQWSSLIRRLVAALAPQETTQ
jgi:AcrR family transcriptional regulator